MTTKKALVLSTAIATVLSALAVSTSQAAVITWGPATNISSSSDIFNAAPLVGAFNVGDVGVPGIGPSAGTNGVAFAPFNIDSSLALVSSQSKAGNYNPGVTFTLATTAGPGFQSSNSNFGSFGVAAPFSLLAPDYQTLLQSAAIVGGGTTPGAGTFTLNMQNLTVGQKYVFQWWANTSDPVGTQLHSATATNGVTLNDNTTGVNGGLGQYSLGEFVADSNSQLITFAAVPNAFGEFAQVNGFLPAVPEPSTVLFGLALFGVCCGSRRRPVQESPNA